MTNIIAMQYNAMDKRPLRALSFVLAIVLAGCIFWDPSRFAAKTSELEIWHGLLLMWAVCAGIIHGVGFRPRAVHWQGQIANIRAERDQAKQDAALARMLAIWIFSSW